MSKESHSKERTFNNRYVFYAFLAFMFGVIVSRRLFGGDIEIILITVIVFIASITLFTLGKKYKHIIMILILFLVGNGFYQLGIQSFNVKNYTSPVTVSARISDDIEDRGYGYNVLLKDVKVNGKSESNINLYIQNCTSRPKAGSKIVYEGKLTRSKPFTLKSFNSSDYRSGARYNSSCQLSEIEFSGGFTKLDEKIRLAVREQLYSHMSQDNAGVAYAVMFGDKNDLNPQIENAYKNAGIIHVLTVSGLHVGFLVTLFYGLLKKCHANRYLRLVLTTIFIVLYAYLCGFTPSVLRAGIMSIIYMLSKSFEREYDSLCSLAVAGFVICLIRPLSPLDIGFLMSFFCVFSIVTLFPVLVKLFSKFLPYKISELISLSFAAQIGILPFLAYFGSSVNILSFMINMIVVPTFGVLYPYLFVVSMLASFIPFMGYLLVVADFTFTFIYMVARFFQWSKLLFPLSAYFFGLTIWLFTFIFGISGYIMLDWVKKLNFVLATTIVFFAVFGLYQIPINPGSRIDYISSGSSYSVVLTNSKNESIAIGYDFNLSRYIRAYRIENLKTYFSLDGVMSESYARYLSSSLGFNAFYSFQSMSDSDEQIVISRNTWVGIGDFRLKYVQVDGDDIGVIVLMDGQCIFVVNDKDLSYNNIESVFSGNLNPDIVFVGQGSYQRSGEDFILLTNNQQNNSNFSHERDGNLRLLLKNNLWNVRRLD